MSTLLILSIAHCDYVIKAARPNDAGKLIELLSKMTEVRKNYELGLGYFYEVRGEAVDVAVSVISPSKLRAPKVKEDESIAVAPKEKTLRLVNSPLRLTGGGR